MNYNQQVTCYLLRHKDHDLHAVVRYSECLFCTDGIKSFLQVSSPHDSLLLQSNITCLDGRCIFNCTKYASKTKVVLYCTKTSLFGFDYKFCEPSITALTAPNIW